MRVLHLWLCLLVGLAGSRDGLAQRVPPLERLDGLSHNTVFSMVQDHQGYLWIGTADGLNRYDGYGVTVFRHDPQDDATLSDNIIRALAETPDGAIWIGTQRGLNRLDPATGRVRRYSINGETSALATLVLDGDGRLWGTLFGTPLTVVRYDPASDRLLVYRFGDEPEDGLSGLFEDGRGRVWARVQGTHARLFRYDPASDRFVSVPGPVVRGTVRVGGGPVWATEGRALGRWDMAGAVFEHVLTLPPMRQPPHLIAARDGRVWIGAETGLLVTDPTTRSLVSVETGGSTLSNTVSALYQDRAGIVWVGTHSGLFRSDPNAKPFRHLSAGDGLPEDAGHPVMAVAETPDGALWVGMLGGGLVRLDLTTGATQTFRHDPRDARSLPNDNVWGLHVDDAGRLWAATEAGLVGLGAAPGTFARIPLPKSPSPGYPEGVPVVYSIAPTSDGRLWVAGPSDAVLVDPQRRAVVRHVSLGERLGWRTVQALCAPAEAPDLLWIGTEGGGLYRFDLATDTVERHAEAGFPGQTVWTFHRDRRGRLWVGSDLGIARLDPVTGAFRHHYDADVLPGALAFSILDDDEGHLWMGTNQGLARFDPGAVAFRSYDLSDGIGVHEYDRRAAVRLRDGTFVFGGLNGLTLFRPEAIRSNRVVPPVVLTGLRVFDGDGEREMVPGESVRLGPRENTLELTFAALNFTNPGRNQYRYRLDGFDRGWVEPGAERRARYTNLPPGDYVFRVIAANNDGIWNEDGVVFPLTVAPPYWRTRWFRLLVGLLVVALGVALYRWRVGYLLGVERLRLRIAADLHDDVGSRLSGIALRSEMIRDRAPLPESDRSELTRVGAEARHLVGALRDIVWFVAPEHDRPGAFEEKMRETATVLLNGTAWTLDADPAAMPHGSGIALRRNVFLVFREALHNVTRHAEATNVALGLRRERGELVLEVRDDGVGFDPETVARGNGLANMRRRAEALGGALSVESHPGAGTALRLGVPLGRATRLRNGAGSRRAAP